MKRRKLTNLIDLTPLIFIFWRRYQILPITCRLFSGDTHLSVVINSSHDPTYRTRDIWICSCYSFTYGINSRGLRRYKLVYTADSEQEHEAVLALHINSCFTNRKIAYASKVTAFNLFSGIPASHCHFKIETTSIDDEAVDICTVSKANVALVMSSSYEDDDYSWELEQHFSLPRLVNLGEVIGVKKRWRFGEKAVFIYFKVKSLVGKDGDLSEGIVTATETTLYRESNVFDSIPALHIDCHVPKSFSLLSEKIVSLILANRKLCISSPLAFLIIGLPGSGSELLLTHLASSLYKNALFHDCLDLMSSTRGASDTKYTQIFQKCDVYGENAVVVFMNADKIGLIPDSTFQDDRIFACLKNFLENTTVTSVFFVCDHDNVKDLSVSLLSLITYEFIVPNLTHEERSDIISSLIDEQCEVDHKKISLRTNGFTFADLRHLVLDATYRKKLLNESVLKTEHFEWAIESRSKSFADITLTSSKVTWDDVGSLDDVKKTIQESLQSTLMGWGMTKRSGILLYGQPGCGKTLLAKAIANEYNIPFLNVKGPELLDKYIGESEANIRKIFDRARQVAPCILFFDELDSLAPSRGRSGDCGGVADRIVSQLIVELDSIAYTKVFVLGATNRPDLIDSSLLIPGRFDKAIEVAGAHDAITRERLLRASSRKINFADDVELSEIASQCDFLKTGAQLHGLIAGAYQDSIRERVQAIEMGRSTELEKLLISKRNFENVLEELNNNLD